MRQGHKVNLDSDKKRKKKGVGVGRVSGEAGLSLERGLLGPL